MKPSKDDQLELVRSAISQVTRRSLLKQTARGGLMASFTGDATLRQTGHPSFASVGHPQMEVVGLGPKGGPRHWLGPHFWGNRLQDWQYRNGRLECLRDEAGHEVRTAAVLTREIVSGHRAGHLRVRTGIAGADHRGGFCGFLIGAGAGKLDYRAAGLVQRGSGIGGGTLCTLETDGQVRFREHTNERHPLAFRELSSQKQNGLQLPSQIRSGDEIELQLDILPQRNGEFDLRLKAIDTQWGIPLSSAIRRQISERNLLGGIALVSSPPPGKSGTRWWFKEFRTAGTKIRVHPDRTFGPIAGTLYSLNDHVLKLSAQLLPISNRADSSVKLQYRPTNGDRPWQDRPVAPIKDGFVSIFRVEGWDTSQDWDYRVVYQDETDVKWYYTGQIRKEPVNKDELSVAFFSCVNTVSRQLEAGANYLDPITGSVIGRYTPANLSFPHVKLIRNIRAQHPDLLAFLGDQIYEDDPTRVTNRENPSLDYLYKWYLWVWAFRGLTRDTPTVTLVDDHDVYQANLWGEDGKKAPNGKYWKGGYDKTAGFVNQVQRTQCGHNPDPYDPVPVDRNISVYYTDFRYGGVDFALLEGRKFKSGPEDAKRGTRLHLLGARQIRFIKKWTDTDRTIPAPKICFAPTSFASIETNPKGQPIKDYDSDGYPKAGRDRAIRALGDAGALVVSGDRHLATLVHHGIDTYTDSIFEFTGPAVSAGYARWFQPSKPLPHATRYPYTGDFTDKFKNKFRMLAVANPKVPFKKLRDSYKTGQTIKNRELRANGYGVLRIDHSTEMITLECWPWNEDPTSNTAEQFPGWPQRLSFATISDH